MAAEMIQRSRRAPSPKSATGSHPVRRSNNGQKELEIVVSPPESATSNFLIAVAGRVDTNLFSSFQPLASSFQNSNNAQKELKIVISPAESATSNFLIAVAGRVSGGLFSSFQPLASSLQNSHAIA